MSRRNVSNAEGPAGRFDEPSNVVVWDRKRDERGAGLLTSGIVATLLLLLLLLASQTLLLLQRSSFADAVAFDAASALATERGSTEREVVNRATSIIGRLAQVRVLSSGDPVVVEIRVPTPGLLRFGPTVSRLIVRTARVRREVIR